MTVKSANLYARIVPYIKEQADAANKLFQNRKNFWNDDYLKFLVEHVWQITVPVQVVDFWCGDGYLGRKLLQVLPSGSSYTGIDSKYFIKKAEATFRETNFSSNFIEADIYNFKTNKKYDLAICQGCLRHVNRPIEVLSNMISAVKKGGIVACVEVNREFENDGLYIEGMDYDDLCTNFDYHPLWRTELENEGRDYAIGMRLPFYMYKLGLHNVDIRMNDKVTFVHPKQAGYEDELHKFVEINRWDKEHSIAENEDLIKVFMNRGISRANAEKFVTMQNKIACHFSQKNIENSFLKVQGLMITYGVK